jgi:hypothetical protein
MIHSLNLGLVPVVTITKMLGLPAHFWFTEDDVKLALSYHH